ncbi:MAG TPA: EamA family transporter RarD [Nocardioides sp.]|nr:EamA family transporter RarD [Nocardioides sp.]
MEERRGVVFGTTAYVLWGVFPLYFPLLAPSGPFEILAHRMVWTCLVMTAVVVAARRQDALRAIIADRRAAALLVVAAAAVTSNWGTYIYGVNNDRVVETSLGYFINPLVTVLLGVVVLHERLRRLQWLALGIGFAAVAVLTAGYGHPPYLSLILAFSFGTYGLAKKQAGVGAVESLAFETAVIAPFALVFLVVLGSTGHGHLTGHGAGHVLLLMSSGLVTAVPLLFFGAAATRVPLTTLGVLQYLAPILQFGLGVTVLGEHMPPERWAGFALVWLALAVFTADALRSRRNQLLELELEASAA